MGASDWQRVKHVLADALDRPPGTRAAFLAEACGDDAPLRAEVEQLLAFEEGSSDFIETSAVARLETGDRLIGTAVGPYRIEEQIGRGGMGTVYRARRVDGGFKQDVALKLIAPGLASDEVLRRFRTERQILAAIAHPYVARLLDGGTLPDGRPYLVMEYIRGQRIDEHCDALKLGVPERLKLFVKVCEAVQYAHQRLVVHRDLKPTNILVQPDGTPKLLDFGIAKLLAPDLVDADESEATGSVLRMMTPEYASPEQFRGEPVTAATDVYALGVLLFELLAGRRPYVVKRRDPQSLVEAICKIEPRSPSDVVIDEVEAGAATTAPADRSAARGLTPGRLRHRLQGDLDRIVLMALRKEPERRYGSVEQLAGDVQRHLHGLPISARDGTFGYRAGKFVGRHKAALAAAVLAALALLGGVVATSRQAHVAERERGRAERRFQELRRLASSLLFDYHEEVAKLPGSTAVRQRLVTDAVRYLDALAREGGDRALQAELAAGYQKVGDVQSQLHTANLGNTAGALRSYEMALKIREALVAADPGDVQARRDLWISCIRLGEALSKSGQMTRALDSQRRALEVAQSLLADRPQDREVQHDVAWSHVSLGRLLLKKGDYAGSLASFRAALASHLVYAGPAPPLGEARYERVVIHQTTGFALSMMGRPGEALPLYRENLRQVQEWVAAEPMNARARRLEMDAREWVALALEETGDVAGALAEHQEALALCRSLLDADMTNMQAHNDIADVYLRTGVVRSRLGRLGPALDNFSLALHHYGQVAAADAADWNVRRQIWLTRRVQADARLRAGDATGALGDYRAALAGFRELSAADPGNVETLHDAALALSGIGQSQGATAEARAALLEAAPILEDLLARSPSNATVRIDLAILLDALGHAHAGRGEWPEARKRYQQAIAHWSRLEAEDALPPLHAARAAESRAAHAKAERAADPPT